MATIPVPNAPVSYESQKLREVLLPRDIPLRDDAAAEPPSNPPAETLRTRRLRGELDKVSMSASVLYVAGFVSIVVLGVIFL